MRLKFPTLGLILKCVSVLALLTSCNQPEVSATPISAAQQVPDKISSPTPAANPTNTGRPASTPKPTATPVATATPNLGSGNYPSCVSSDPEHICIGLKLVSYQDSNGAPVITEADAVTLVNQMNTSWSQCNIAFQLEVFQIVDPSEKGLSFSPDWQTETYTVRREFADNTRFLVAAVGPWTVSTIAVTTMPGSGVYGTIVDKQYSHNPLTVGHELGHYQGLYHVEDTSNLMSAYIGNNTKALTADQCATSRKTDLSNWTAMLRRP